MHTLPGVYISSNAARLKQNESDWLCYYDIPTVNHAFDLVRKRAGLRRKCAEIGYVVVESDLLIVPTKWWLLVGEARYPKLCGPMCVFITAVPITKLLARGGGEDGGHVLPETTSRDHNQCELVCPSPTNESWERDIV